jgi:FkbM family methyltransferase
MTSTGIVRTVRDRFHPLYHARRVPLIRAALAGVDVGVWAKLEGIEWPVRVRAVRHASYLVRSATPEREMAALACAVVDVLRISRFCDVGANFGYYAWLLKSRSPDLEVDLVEPESENLKLIDATLARTPLAGMSVHRVAASDVSGRAAFQRDPVSGATGTLGPAGDSFARRHWRTSASMEVSTCTLDGLLTDKVDLLKIDVEGHEERVLGGASALLERDSPVLFFECFHGSNAAPAVLRAIDYELYDAECLAEPTAATTNYLAVPATVRDRIPELRDAWRRNTGA